MQARQGAAIKKMSGANASPTGRSHQESAATCAGEFVVHNHQPLIERRYPWLNNTYEFGGFGRENDNQLVATTGAIRTGMTGGRFAGLCDKPVLMKTNGDTLALERLLRPLSRGLTIELARALV